MPCRFIYDEIAGKVFIPECMSAAVHGPHACICEENIQREARDKTLNAKNQKIIALQKELAQCYRTIQKLSKRNINEPRKAKGSGITGNTGTFLKGESRVRSFKAQQQGQAEK